MPFSPKQNGFCGKNIRLIFNLFKYTEKHSRDKIQHAMSTQITTRVLCQRVTEMLSNNLSIERTCSNLKGNTFSRTLNLIRDRAPYK